MKAERMAKREERWQAAVAKRKARRDEWKARKAQQLGAEQGQLMAEKVLHMGSVGTGYCSVHAGRKSVLAGSPCLWRAVTSGHPQCMRPACIRHGFGLTIRAKSRVSLTAGKAPRKDSALAAGRGERVLHPPAQAVRLSALIDFCVAPPGIVCHMPHTHPWVECCRARSCFIILSPCPFCMLCNVAAVPTGTSLCWGRAGPGSGRRSWMRA